MEQNQWKNRKNSSVDVADLKKDIWGAGWFFGRGLKQDFSRRLHFYFTDYLDGITGPKTKQKMFSR